ncbi:MAG: S-layer homology domain-containing protein [Oscillospiraceae bacterium]|nr:S-layer homology domain-containing protein [Oscillospiraceae bacterium]MBQ6697812.1 S-layer homology domain-containing protein [Oscillospiraceae bacterium]
MSVEYTCTKREIAVASKPFSDSNDYYVPYIAALGIINGYPDGTFRPKDAIKRQDAAIMLQRLASFLEADTSGNVRTFADAAQISAYAKSGVDYVTALGIMNGNANGTFSPLNNITREQAVITIMNAYNNIR